MINTSSLIEVPMGKTSRRSFDAFRYYDDDGYLVAKTCTRCGRTKHATEFAKNSRTKDKLFNFCKECATSHAKEWVVANQDRRKSYERTNGALLGSRYRDKLRGRTDNEITVVQQERYPNGVKFCPACGNTKPLDKFYTSPTRSDGLKRICKKCRNTEESSRNALKPVKYWISKSIPIECYICAGPYEDIEHVVPRSLGGLDSMTNLLPSCAKCNRGPLGKWDTPLEEWLRSREELDTQEIIGRVLSYGVDPTPPKLK